jgi:nicotinate-nucleotide--dimethylbenzimidazole phosphoribosyltransferase
MDSSVTLSQARKLLEGKAKPPGSLGLLEEWAARLCVLQGTLAPNVSSPALVVFAADHGAALPATQGGRDVSAYPASVTAHIVQALGARRGAGTVLAQAVGVTPECIRIVDVGVCRDPVDSIFPGVIDRRVNMSGTRNFVEKPAMTPDECARAEACGATIVAELADGCTTNAIAIGEVGIGNTTASAALLSAMTGVDPAETCGPGSGLGEEGVVKKIEFVRQALRQHSAVVQNAQENSRAALAALGGLEIAAIVGAIHEAARRNIAILVDGFIVSVAALIAVQIVPTAAACLFLATRSAEPGHAHCVRALTDVMWEDGLPGYCASRVTALEMGLRLGEGTGAVLAIPILQSAAAVCTTMISLQEALEKR